MMTSMKKYIYFLMMSALALGITVSCTDEPNPFDEFDDLGKGAFARKLSSDGTFNFFDVPNSAIVTEVEFYDENKGKNVSEYRWTIAYIDKANRGANNAGPVDFLTIPSSSFVVNSDGLPGTTFTFSFQAALDAFGFTLADINGGDTFRYSATIVKSDGSTFSFSNTGGNIISSSPFSGLFIMDVNIICPSSLEGVLDYTTVSWCNETISSSVEWLADGKGKYHIEDNFGDFSYGAYDACYGDGTPGSAGFGPEGNLQLIDACNVLSMGGASQWGEKYWFNSVTVSGDSKTLTLDWENDYGEAGVTDLKRQDGADWPALK